MKTRRGFVSNSSTSSFVVLGFQVDESTLDKRGYLERTLGKETAEERIQYNQDEYLMNYEEALEDEWYEALDSCGHCILHEGDAVVPGTIVGMSLTGEDDESDSPAGFAGPERLADLAAELRVWFGLDPSHPWKIYWGVRQT